MIKGKKIVVVLPAYNAKRTLEETVKEIPRDVDKDSYIINLTGKPLKYSRLGNGPKS